MRISVLKEEVQDAKYFPYQFFFSPPTQLSRRNNTVREFKKKKKNHLKDYACSQRCIKEKSDFFPHSGFNGEALM